jgi:hypothetical protein
MLGNWQQKEAGTDVLGPSKSQEVLNNFNNGSCFVSDFSVGTVIKQVITKLEGGAARAKEDLENIVASIGAAATAGGLK